jgi:hypothetical protein
MQFTTLVCFSCVAFALGQKESSPRPTLHLPLRSPAEEVQAAGLKAEIHGVEAPIDEAAPAAKFDGRSSRIEVDVDERLDFGDGDFTLSAWIEPDQEGEGWGDVLCKFDPDLRRGFALSIVERQGVAHSQANVARLEFWIDDATEPVWRDRGRPGDAVYVHALASFDGALYAGTCEPAAGESGGVYRLEGENAWVDCGKLDDSNAVVALAEFQGRLYAGTGRYRTGGSALPESENPNLGGRVFRYDGGRRWTLVGELPGVEAVGGLAVFRSQLYASSLYRPAGLFRYERDGRWTPAPLPPGDKRVESMICRHGRLFATSYDDGRVYRFDGDAWSDSGALGENTQCYAFAIHWGRLHCSTWPSGRVYRWDDGAAWTDTGRLGEELEVMGMAVYNGKLYAGTLPLAEVHRYDGDSSWRVVGRVDHTPDVKYRRAWSMAVHGGELFVGTLPSGRVHSMEAGKCVACERPLSKGWRHVVAQRVGGRLRLFVDGELAAESTPLPPHGLNVSCQAPLMIGSGPSKPFGGRIRDVRVYDRAVSADDAARPLGDGRRRRPPQPGAIGECCNAPPGVYNIKRGR